MAYEIGDDAVAAGIILVPGTAPANEIDEWINRLADELARRTMAIMSIAKGGTGQTTVAGARAALEVVTKVGAGDIRILNIGGGRIQFEIPGYADPTTLAHVADVNYVAETADAALARANRMVDKAGDLMTGHLWLPNATPATSGYVAAYINGDGRVSKGASSERFKKFISRILPTSLGNIWPELHRFQMRTGDGTWKYGYIAERLAESDDLRPFVVYDSDGRPESIDFVALGIAQNAALNERVKALEARE